MDLEMMERWEIYKLLFQLEDELEQCDEREINSYLEEINEIEQYLDEKDDWE